jgi:DNA-directed RNA polymerase specialized sigma24 family protein
VVHPTSGAMGSRMDLVEAMCLIGPMDRPDAAHNARVAEAASVLRAELRRLAKVVHVKGFGLSGTDAQDEAVQKVLARLSRAARGETDSNGRTWDGDEKVTAYLIRSLKNHICDLGRAVQRERRRQEAPPTPVAPAEPELDLQDVQRVLSVALTELERSNPPEVSRSVRESLEDMVRLHGGHITLPALAAERASTPDGLYQRHHRARERILKAGRRCRTFGRLTDDDHRLLVDWIVSLKRRKVTT